VEACVLVDSSDLGGPLALRLLLDEQLLQLQLALIWPTDLGGQLFKEWPSELVARSLTKQSAT
jgi:hypothetical protein